MTKKRETLLQLKVPYDGNTTIIFLYLRKKSLFIESFLEGRKRTDKDKRKYIYIVYSLVKEEI